MVWKELTTRNILAILCEKEEGWVVLNFWREINFIRSVDSVVMSDKHDKESSASEANESVDNQLIILFIDCIDEGKNW
jgi:hypothetical protein